MLKIVPLLFLFLLLAGCSPIINVSSDYDPEADFSTLRSFAWLPEPQYESGDPLLEHNSLLARRIQSAVESELAVKGYTKTKHDSADFALGYHVTRNQETSVQVIDRYYDYYRPGWRGYTRHRGMPGSYGNVHSEAIVYQYQSGTLILDIVIPANRQLIWRGTAKAEIDPNSTPEEKETLIRNAVREILAHFPPP